MFVLLMLGNAADVAKLLIRLLLQIGHATVSTMLVDLCFVYLNMMFCGVG